MIHGVNVSDKTMNRQQVWSILTLQFNIAHLSMNTDKDTDPKTASNLLSQA